MFPSVLEDNSLRSEHGVDLTSITDLTLSDNELQLLPAVCCEMPHLRELKLDRNKLKYLPEAIGSCCGECISHA